MEKKPFLAVKNVTFQSPSDTKQKLFLEMKNSIFHSPKNRIFPKGLTHAFSQKMYFFS